MNFPQFKSEGHLNSAVPLVFLLMSNNDLHKSVSSSDLLSLSSREP